MSGSDRLRGSAHVRDDAEATFEIGPASAAYSILLRITTPNKYPSEAPPWPIR